MKRHTLQAAVLLLAALALAPATARAQDETSSMLGRLNYEFSPGVMQGVGPQGNALRRGPAVSFNVHGESAIGMQLGVEATYASSDDFFKTRFLSLGGIARLSPMPEDYKVYVQLGAALYNVSYGNKDPGVVSPGNRTRPGGGFGLGFDAVQSDHYNVGALLTYSGVVLARSAARSYITAAVTFTFKPSAY